jgi:amidophosphoribosyltransferase
MCGIFGIYGHPEASELTLLGLYALQHRGDEGAGIAAGDGEELRYYKGLGLVSEVFSDESTLHGLKGYLAIGHNRYSTTGASIPVNTQPLVANCRGGPVAIAHNGNLVNVQSLKQQLNNAGALFQTTMDSEIIVHLIARSQQEPLYDRLIDALIQVKGSYALVIASKDSLIAARDPLGFKPLCLGELKGAWVIASESRAFDVIGATYVRDIDPGEILNIDADGLTSLHLLGHVTDEGELLLNEEPTLHPSHSPQTAFCIFEYIYFSMPDSRIFGDYVDKTRRRLGRQLAIEQPVEADIVISVPDSSNTAALGYSQTSGIRFEIGLIRNHYIGRTFISPDQKDRDLKARVKYNTVGGVLKGKRIVVVEDSIVRGTTMRQLVHMLREAGAKEVHVRVSSPPIRHPCFYGIDFQTRKELVAASRTIEQIKEEIGVDSLGYLSLEGMLQSVPNSTHAYCTACFSGHYPVPVEDGTGKDVLEQK